MTGTEHLKNPSDRDMLEDLFRHVSARERPPAEDEQMVREALHSQWSEMTGRRKRRRTAIYWAAAASVVLAVIVSVNLVRSPGVLAPVMQVAMVSKVVGSPLLRSGEGGAAQRLDVSGALDSGQRLLTPAGSRLAIRWANGASIRLDENTELLLLSIGEIELLAGSVYVATDDASATADLAIKTAAGQVRHIGTRYMATVSASGTAVSVREGRVLLQAQGVEAVASRGEQLAVDAAGKRSMETISTYGSLWDWTEELSPVYSSDGSSMADFLDWVARESGREIEFATAAAEELAEQTLLRGNVDLEPMRALELLLKTSDLESETRGGTILVRLRPAS
jgi:ferric-dicitrate binding protein FerR (iron transport regulator)